jgi:uncharacterized protein
MVVPGEAITDFCHRHHICKLALFGSVLRDDFRPDSDVDVVDVDVVVKFEPDHIPGFAFFCHAGRTFRTSGAKSGPNSLNLYFRNQVEAEAEPV